MILLRLKIIVLLGIIVPSVRSFFLISLSNFTVTNSLITCFTKINETGSDDYNLCAIRVYTATIDSDVFSTSSVYDGMWYTNTFRQLIKQCTGFSNTTDIGSGACTKLPYEYFDKMALCICAETLCNRNFDTCTSSVASMLGTGKLPDVVPDISNNTVTCSQTTNAPSTLQACSEHLFINTSVCTDYISKNSVLCAITTTGDQTIQEALISQNYAQYPMNTIHTFQSQFSNTVMFNETDTNAYYSYNSGVTNAIQGCICTTSAYCNMNLNTCISRVVMTANTSDSTTISTPTNTTYIMTGISPLSSTGGSTTVSTASTISIDASKTTSPYQSTTPNTTSSSLSTSTPIISTSVLLEATQSPSAVVATLVVNTEQPTPGESGLGSAASAGIACGIIFTALIIIGEIVVFKFFSSGLANGSGAGARAFNYAV